MDVTKWTIMIYMAGDNNLSADMAYSLEEIRKVANQFSSVVNIFVYFDSVCSDAPTYYFDFTDPSKVGYYLATHVERAFVTRAERKRRNHADAGPLPAESDNEDSAAINSLLNFVNWCVNDTNYYPVLNSDEGMVRHIGKRTGKYSLILSGHSSAFKDLSLMADVRSNYYMTIRKLNFALEQIVAMANYHNEVKLLNQKLDMLGFDSCTMGMLEIVHGFRNFANTLIASEGNVPSAGWTYGTMLPAMINDYAGKSDKDPAPEIAKGLVEKFIEQQNYFVLGGVNVDLAAWDLSGSGSDSKIDKVISAVDNVAIILLQKLGDQDRKDDVTRAIILSHWKCQSYMAEQNIDVSDFFGLLALEIVRFDSEDKTGIVAACNAVVDAVKDCILQCGFSGGKYQYSNGISIFFPWSKSTFDSYLGSYERLDAFIPVDAKPAVLANWKAFLDKFLSESSLRPHREIQGQPDNKMAPIAAAGTDARDLRSFTVGNRSFLGWELGQGQPAGVNDGPDVKDNPIIKHDRDNPRIAGNRGEDIAIQIKNVEMPWNISGFTKEPE